MIKVRVLERQGQAALVEYHRRKYAFVPVSEIDNDTISRETLELSIPVDGEVRVLPDLNQLNCELIKTNLEQLLKKKDLLTLTDIQRNQQEFINCIVTAVKRPLFELFKESAK